MLLHNGIVLFLGALDFDPIEGTAIFHSDQLHTAVCSPEFNFML